MSRSKAEDTVWSVSAGKLKAAIDKFAQDLGDEGARIIVQLDEDPDFRSSLATFAVQQIDAKSSKRARAILGDDFIGPDEIAKARDVQYCAEGFFLYLLRA